MEGKKNGERMKDSGEGRAKEGAMEGNKNGERMKDSGKGRSKECRKEEGKEGGTEGKKTRVVRTATKGREGWRKRRMGTK